MNKLTVNEMTFCFYFIAVFQNFFKTDWCSKCCQLTCAPRCYAQQGNKASTKVPKTTRSKKKIPEFSGPWNLKRINCFSMGGAKTTIG